MSRPYRAQWRLVTSLFLLLGVGSSMLAGATPVKARLAEPLPRLPLFSLPDDDSTSVLAIAGDVYQYNGVTHWPDGDTVRVTNLRTAVSLTSLIGALERGRYGVMFCAALGSNQMSQVGDSLYFDLPAEQYIPNDPVYVLTAEDVADRILLLDLVVNADLGTIREWPTHWEHGLSVFPNPAVLGGSDITFRIAQRDASLEGCRQLAIVNLDGRCVRVLDLVPGVNGAQTLAWDGRDRLGRLVPRGVYSIQARGGRLNARSTTGRLVVLR